ncbi:hypothetical protein L249_4743 [Ophiocordyceps polyrhachis-furcata BCC 54312]|uniref:Uncharacterized protein n=1 Tax=Ophiocordyceps polyrhachis-furcata BCC 54312 TaxID=1330021 RepID=A0A367L2T7_9HYPO|nr:hypothetical protein L249_4743 [Ophiocordyceps polyrhachis-furcata BCC 54312]
MPCPGRCFAFIGNKPEHVDHDKHAEPVRTWYFCPVHRKFHAMLVCVRGPQPRCGECAVVFFAGNSHACWFLNDDLAAVMTDSETRMRDSFDDMDALLREIEEARGRRLSLGDATMDDFVVDDTALLDEIPREDETYIKLGSELLPHTRAGIKNLYLFPFLTFEGFPAYQPCSVNIDFLGLFTPLDCLETDADPVFRQARTWSCIVQARHRLPKPLRWVLATIYNFSYEMMRSEVDEPTLWKMRAWLLHWYSVADRLLVAFDIPASTPGPDWFSSPKPAQARARLTQRAPARKSGSRPSSSADGTVIHRPMPRRRSSESPVLSSDILVWLRSLQCAEGCSATDRSTFPSRGHELNPSSTAIVG